VSNTYLATFPAGCYAIVSKQLKSFKITELKITNNDESSVIFVSSLTIERIIEMRFFTNVYIMVGSSSGISKLLKGRYFRLMYLKKGEPQPLDKNERLATEEQIKNKFGLTPNAHLSRNDFFVIERVSLDKMLGLMLPKAKFKREKTSAGELHPELAHILCLVSGIKAKHIVLDMFAGYGSIPFEAARGFGCKHVIAVDQQMFNNRHDYPSIEWHKADATKLGFLADSCIDRIVTDPPWGNFEHKADDELNGLYDKSISEMHRVLKPEGVAVILSGSDLLNELIKSRRSFKVLSNYTVLVSGKKARIFKLQKQQAV
jgi:tRNA G10  N-methylase Trm11